MASNHLSSNNHSGYYRFPTLYDNTIIFASEDDLWAVSSSGGVAQRLTSNLGEVTYPMLSPDGSQLAFVGREEGSAEVYVMPAAGGRARRLTYLSSNVRVMGWMPSGTEIIFTSNYAQPVASEMVLFRVDAESNNGEVTPLPYGAARAIAFGPILNDGGGRGVVIGRNTGDAARWKRYRGGTAGHLWIDRAGSGEFVRLLAEVAGNIASPMWLTNGVEDRTGEDRTGRIYFVSDHEGIGNLYSCQPDGSDLQRHSDHEDYYARNPSTDGRRIVYHAGADLYVFDPAQAVSTRVEVRYPSPRVQRNRKFADAGRYLDGYHLHPSGQALALTSRGKAYTFFNQEGPVVQYGKRQGVRYREPTWLHDGRRLALVSDEGGEEQIEIYKGQPTEAPARLQDLDIGRVVEMKASPTDDILALNNHRHELLLVDLAAGTLTVVDRSLYRNMTGFDWSPDGRWLAYSYAATSRTSEIRLYHLPDPAAAPAPDAQPADAPEATTPDTAVTAAAPPITSRGERYTITRPVLHDLSPAFDPDGKFLYFLSMREFNPVYDGLHFDLGFPWGMRPYLITLHADLPNPFIPVPELEGDEDEDEEEAHDEDDDAAGDEGSDDEGGADDADDDGADDDEDDIEDEDGDDEDDELDGEADLEGGGADDEEDATDFWRAAYRTRARSFPARTHAQESGKTHKGGDAAKNGKQGADKPGADKAGTDKAGTDKSDGEKDKPKPLRIDLDGIERRVVAFPVPDGRYGQIEAISNKALFTVFSIHGQLDSAHQNDEDDEIGSLRAYDFKEYRAETLADGVASFALSANRKKLIYATHHALRVINAGEKAPSSSGSTRKSGWIDLHRVKVSVDPQTEWEQMFREAWRLQRDQFWTEDMAEVDWQTVYTRYFQLIPRVSTRGEFSDLLWEMQGELGTSHAYEFGGDYRSRPHYGQGFLGAEVRWDAAAGGYRVEAVVLGDPWDADATSPLTAPGVHVQPGEVIVAVNGQPLDAETSPAQMLVNQAGHEVLLTLLDKSADHAKGGSAATPAEASPRVLIPTDVGADGTVADDKVPDNRATASDTGARGDIAGEHGTEDTQPATPPSAAPLTPDATSGNGSGNGTQPRFRTVIVKTIGSEAPARYRQWVEANRRKVHEATDGRIGYVHIPDMGANGYAEFHRGYLAEVDRDGLVIDVRYNGGGHVSQLILEKLARRRLGYDLSRWGGMIPYPVESVAGPLVALTNEHAGSDGDIFCHSFKMLKLGPLVGKRTWGGVIGIAPQHALVDGTVTTQPEYSFWFEDVGWALENYGTDPDIEVDITPQDYQAGNDPQLARAIDEALRIMATMPRKLPEMTTKPSRALPKLPPRLNSTS